MTQPITKYRTADGKEFDNEVDADAHEVLSTREAEINAFANEYFPSPEGSTRKNPHACTAAKAIALWIGSHA